MLEPVSRNLENVRIAQCAHSRGAWNAAEKSDLPNGLPRPNFGKGLCSVLSFYGKPT
jgi:hypothetical protein